MSMSIEWAGRLKHFTAWRGGGCGAKANQKGSLVVAPDGLPVRIRQETNFQTNPRVWNSGQLRHISPRTAINDLIEAHF